MLSTTAAIRNRIQDLKTPRARMLQSLSQGCPHSFLGFDSRRLIYEDRS